MITLAEELLLSTVKVEATLSGQPISTGTGFFWGTQTPAGLALSIITNKHVLEGADGLSIHMHTSKPDNASEPSGQHLRLNIRRVPDGELAHPDPVVDLIALSITSLLEQATSLGHTLCYRMMTREQIPDTATWDMFDSIEDVLMIGCPRGISDEVNNMPLVRRGITATSVRRNFNGKQEFMIDLACFPGSSGSPVFFFNTHDYLMYRQSDGSMKAKPKIALLGVLYAGPLLSNDGRIVLGQQPTVTIQTMMHLGQVIRSTRILEMDDLIIYKLAAMGMG